MATSTRYLSRTLRQLSRNAPFRRHTIQNAQPSALRTFSKASTRRAEEPKQNPNVSRLEEELDTVGKALEESEYLTPEKPYTASDLNPQERADYELLSKDKQRQYLKLQNHFKAVFESPEAQSSDVDLEALATQADREIEREGGPDVALNFPTQRAKGQEIGYWADEEDDEIGVMEDADNDWSEEHITTVAESELDLHRDVREYTRLAAWDLPLLQQFAKPFQPPNHSTPLRFRYTTYMGETHPAQNKVVVEFCSKDLLQNPNQTYKLSEAQRVKLLKLVGVRYNPSTDVVKMSCEKFGSAAQNKRYLGELVGKLIKEAKDKRDMLEDIPLDLRHHKAKTVHVYPEKWKLQGKTIQKVLEARQEMKLLAGDEETVPVDGARIVEQYVRVGNIRPAQMLTR